jgi:hypothetical protein
LPASHNDSSRWGGTFAPSRVKYGRGPMPGSHNCTENDRSAFGGAVWAIAVAVGNAAASASNHSDATLKVEGQSEGTDRSEDDGVEGRLDVIVYVRG